MDKEKELSLKKEYWFKIYVRECDRITKKIVSEDFKTATQYKKYLKSGLRMARKADKKYQKYQKQLIFLKIHNKTA